MLHLPGILLSLVGLSLSSTLQHSTALPPLPLSLPPLHSSAWWLLPPLSPPLRCMQARPKRPLPLWRHATRLHSAPCQRPVSLPTLHLSLSLSLSPSLSLSLSPSLSLSLSPSPSPSPQENLPHLW